MESLPLYIPARASPARFSSAPERELPLQEIAALLTGQYRVADEELELVELRCQPLLAIMNLEELFAEGKLDRV
jgi:hypothetical protein